MKTAFSSARERAPLSSASKTRKARRSSSMRSSSDLSLRKDRPVAAPVIVRTLEMRLLAGIALRTVAQYFAVHPRPAD